MPIKIPKTLPAYATLLNENVFVIDDERAQHQDIRTLRVAILNLMPTKPVLVSLCPQQILDGIYAIEQGAIAA